MVYAATQGSQGEDAMVLSDDDLCIEECGTYFVSLASRCSVPDLLADCRATLGPGVRLRDLLSPPKGIDHEAIELVELVANQEVTPCELARVLRERGLRPATAVETLGMIATTTRDGGSFSPGLPLICLGDADGRVAEISAWANSIRLDILPVPTHWWGHYLCLAFKC
jgi:hypothetical protein